MGKRRGAPMNPLDSFPRTLYQNSDAFDFFTRKIIKMATSCFDWSGLPETVDETFLERGLFFKGSMLFFKDEILGYLALPSTPAGELDIYNLPKYREAYATGANNFHASELDSVLIFNDALRMGSMPDVYYFAARLEEAKRIQDVNLNAQKTPVLVLCDENQRLSLENLYTDYSGNKPVIFGDKKLTLNPINAIKTEAPYLVDKLDTHMERVWGEVCEYYGVPNVRQEKKERLTNDEVGQNSGVAKVNGYGRLKQRKLACNLINIIFPELKVSVDWSESLKESWGMDSDEIEYGAEDILKEGVKLE